jgi:hypothetical protein
MSTNTQTALETRRAALATTANEIDRIAQGAMAVFEQAGNFAQELQVAQAIVDMRQILTPEIMAPIVALMNTDLGFRTDRDPKTASQPMTPYSMEVVKEVFIESKLRGFHSVGNEFNIIAGRFYGAQAGFKRKVRETTKGTFESSIDVPVMAPDGKSAKIKCRATWKVDGKGSVESIGVKPEDPCEFLVRVNAFMGADAINGKAERKLLKRVYERITGRSVPDADVDDGAIPVNATVSRATETAAAPKFDSTAGAAESKAAEPASDQSRQSAPAPGDENAEAEAGLAPVKPKPTQQPELKVVEKASQPPATPQETLAEFMTDAEVSFEHFRKWAIETERLEGKDADSIATWSELPAEFCTALQKDGRAINKCIIRCKTYAGN